MDKNKIIQMRKEGKTYRELALLFGVSKQRIHQIITGYVSPANRVIFKLKNPIPFNKDNKLFKGIGTKHIQEALYKKALYNQEHNPIEKYLKNITKSTGIKNGSRERIREIIRLRDNHQCQWCGKKWQIGTRQFDTHHIFGDNNDTLKCDRDFNKQITLCHKCHLVIDSWKMVRT